ncbi:hypothetical protein [Haladaptatus sp. CMAA 1911]|uniref:DUF7344 domain-containing protein n=1 Tax=unclassified Haladaptatus TaxID=2622732 RepID=UPI0037541AF1
MSAPLRTDDPLTPDLTLGTASKLLKKSMRREIIRYFIAEETTTANLSQLADYVHEEIDSIDSSEHARIRLDHIHLPLLADSGVVELDERSETIRYRNGELLKHLLEIVDAQESPN